MRNFRRLAVLAVLILGLVGVGASPASAGTTQISGTATFEDPGGLCADLPSGFSDYPGLVMSGDLNGCWYTDVLTAKDNGAPSGVYLETGRELFVPFDDHGQQLHDDLQVRVEVETRMCPRESSSRGAASIRSSLALANSPGSPVASTSRMLSRMGPSSTEATCRSETASNVTLAALVDGS